MSALLLVIASGTLLWTAITDFREFRIRNDQVLLLAALYFAYAFASGSYVAMPWNIGFALLIGAASLLSYWLKQMGGGDTKLLTAAALWTGPSSAPVFAILLAVFVALHYAAAKLGWVTSKRSPAGTRLPLAPSVAAALLGVFVTGYLAPVR
jgi:Flp pilus assembly protein protease CpaA